MLLCSGAQSCLTLCDPVACQAPLPWDFPGKNTGVGCHFLLQVMFLTQGSNPHRVHLLLWQVDSLPLRHLGSPINQLFFFFFGCTTQHVGSQFLTLEAQNLNHWTAREVPVWDL